MIYKKLIFEMKKKKWDGDPTGFAKAFYFTIRKEGKKKPLFAMGIGGALGTRADFFGLTLTGATIF